jgi:hypothetical protein
MTKDMSSAPQAPALRAFSLTLVALVLAVSFAVRIRLLDAPLERDEGEHAYMAQTMLAGNPPWKLAYNMKLPGADSVYCAFLAAFGQTAGAIRLGLLIVNAITLILVGLLGRRLFGFLGGTVAAACYGMLSLSRPLFGTIAHSTHFVALFAVVGLLLQFRAGRRPISLFVAGLAFGLAFLMKQPGIAFAGFGALWLVWALWRHQTDFGDWVRALGAWSSGVALPYALVCLTLWREGVFPRFWFWTVTLAQAYAGQRTLSEEAGFLFGSLNNILWPDLALWTFAAWGVLAALPNPNLRRAGLFTLALLFFSFAAVSAGGSFNPNYFLMMTPAVALAAGAGVAAAYLWIDRAFAERRRPVREMLRFLPLSGFAAACMFSVAMQGSYLFSMSPYEFSRSVYGLNPFPEAIQVGDHSDPGARVAVLGSEAEIYFYSRRAAASGYLFTYGLMETHQYAARCQEEMIEEVSAAEPEFIVFVGVPTSWMVRETSSKHIFTWFADYTKTHYDIAGVIEMPWDDPAVYVWGAGAASHKVATENYLVVYRRRGPSPPE